MDMLNLNSLLDQFPLGQVNLFLFDHFCYQDSVNKIVPIKLLSKLFDGVLTT